MIDPHPTDATRIRSQFEARTNYYCNRIARIKRDTMEYPDNDSYKWHLKIAIEGLIATIACYSDAMNVTFNAAQKELNVSNGEIEYEILRNLS